jgi:hypothetical protein
MPIAAREITLPAGQLRQCQRWADASPSVPCSRGQIGWNGGYSGRHMAW